MILTWSYGGYRLAWDLVESNLALILWTTIDPKAYDSEAPYLTVYEMPDVGYRKTAEFKGLDGQSEPRKELPEGVFRKARFDTRFYECVQEFGADVATGMFPIHGYMIFRNAHGKNFIYREGSV